jgi:hypothetical protein
MTPKTDGDETKPDQLLRGVNFIILGIGALSTIGLMLWEARWNSGVIEWLIVAGFAFWAAGPYVALGVLNILSKSRVGRLLILVVSLLTVGLGLAEYYDAFFVHLDAQSGLVFVFIPLFQWGVTGLLLSAWAVLEVRRMLMKRKSPEGPPPGSSE